MTRQAGGPWGWAHSAGPSWERSTAVHATAGLVAVPEGEGQVPSGLRRLVHRLHRTRAAEHHEGAVSTAWAVNRSAEAVTNHPPRKGFGPTNGHHVGTPKAAPPTTPPPTFANDGTDEAVRHALEPKWLRNYYYYYWYN